MKVYLVGGAVRDLLLWRTPKDYDYVVVGSTPEEMLAAGYEQVGAHFPVFLHPETREEYALARTEVKNGNGYLGFDCHFGPEVTLEEDLIRRDLTINAMAQDLQTGEIIDPFGGQEDLRNGILRNTSRAFSEDPVRVLRVARMMARYNTFQTACQLDDLVEEMCASGTFVSELTSERVFAEMEKALGESQPSRFFRYLHGLGIFPELDALSEVPQPANWHPEGDAFEHTMWALDYASRYKSRIISFSVLCHDFGKHPAYVKYGNLHGHEAEGVPVVANFCDRLRVPNAYCKQACLVTKYHGHVHQALRMKPKKLRDLLVNFKDKMDLCRFLDACVADARGRGEKSQTCEVPGTHYLYTCAVAMWNTDTKAITSSMEQGPKVGEAIRIAQIDSIRNIRKS